LQGSRIDFPNFSEFFKTVTSASDRFRQVLNANTVSVSQNTSDLQQTLVIQALTNLINLIQMQTLSFQEQALQQQEQQQIDAENGAVTQYNQGVTQDQQQTQALTTAIDNYNQAVQQYGANSQQAQDALTAYNNQAVIYNNYVNTRNPQITNYNNSVTTYTQELSANQQSEASIDQLLASLNPPVGPMPPQPTTVPTTVNTLPPAPTAPPVPPTSDFPTPQTVNVTIPNVTPATRVNVNISFFFAPILLATQLALTFTNKQILNFALFNEFYKYTIPGTPITLPTAFTPDTQLTNTGGSAASLTAGLSAVSTNLDNPNLTRIIGSSIYLAVLKSLSARIALPSTLSLNLQFLQQQILLLQGIAAGFDGIPILGDRLASLGLKSNAINVTTAVAFADNVLKLVGSGAISAAFINNFPELAKLKLSNPDAFEALVAAFNVSLLENALLSVSIATGQPGLAPQLFANTSGLSAADASLAASSGSNFLDVLNNPISRFYVSQTLASVIGQNSATKVLNAVAGQIGPFTPPSQVNAAFAQALGNLGVSNPTQISNQLVNVLQGETLPYLNSPFTAANTDQVGTTLAQTLALRGFNEPLAGSIVNTALENTLAQAPFQSNRDFRTQLVTALENANGNINSALALLLANQAVTVLATGNPPTVQTANINSDVLKASIANQLNNANLPAGVNPTTLAESIANNLLAINTFNDLESLRQAIREDLAKAGTPPVTAHDVAQSAVVQNKPSAGVNPLATPGLSTVLSPNALATQLKTQVAARLEPEIGVELSNNIAGQIAGVLFGAAYSNDRVIADQANPLSFLSEMTKAHSHLKKVWTDEYFSQLADNQHEVDRPTFDAFITESYLTSPAKNILMSYQTSLQDRINSIPSNWQHPIDIFV
jgi:hypothetical protein